MPRTGLDPATGAGIARSREELAAWRPRPDTGRAGSDARPNGGGHPPVRRARRTPLRRRALRARRAVGPSLTSGQPGAAGSRSMSRGPEDLFKKARPRTARVEPDEPRFRSEREFAGRIALEWCITSHDPAGTRLFLVLDFGIVA